MNEKVGMRIEPNNLFINKNPIKYFDTNLFIFIFIKKCCDSRKKKSK